MSYLGYEWENQVSILASRITLYLQKEIKLSFLSTATVKVKGEYDKEPQEYKIQGFCLSRYNVPKDILEEMVADLKCIHINKLYTYETAFAVCAYPSVMQAWYDMMWEGTVATKLIHHVGGTHGLMNLSEEEHQELELQFQEETERCLV
ncbi:MAG: hypothetical protein ACK55Z_32390 [bacterium]